MKRYLVYTEGDLKRAAHPLYPQLRMFDDLDQAKEQAVARATYGDVAYIAETTNIMEYASVVTGKSLR